MGISTDGQLSFGIDFGECPEFPWMEEKYENEIDGWWRDVNGFVNPFESPYTDEGSYKDGVNENSIEIYDYHDYTNKWDNDNPIPIEIVHHCSGDCTFYVLAVKDKCYYNSRGYAEIITADKMLVSTEDIKVFKDFLHKYNINTEKEPAWLLTSYWG